MDQFSPNQVATILVEHLATFSTTSPQHEHITPRMALQRLFKMEKTSGTETSSSASPLSLLCFVFFLSQSAPISGLISGLVSRSCPVA